MRFPRITKSNVAMTTLESRRPFTVTWERSYAWIYFQHYQFALLRKMKLLPIEADCDPLESNEVDMLHKVQGSFFKSPKSWSGLCSLSFRKVTSTSIAYCAKLSHLFAYHLQNMEEHCMSVKFTITLFSTDVNEKLLVNHRYPLYVTFCVA